MKSILNKSYIESHNNTAYIYVAFAVGKSTLKPSWYINDLQMLFYKFPLLFFLQQLQQGLCIKNNLSLCLYIYR